MRLPSLLSAALLLLSACGPGGDTGKKKPPVTTEPIPECTPPNLADWTCELSGGTATDDLPDSLDQIGCEDDFLALGSLPLDASVPGAISVKWVIDRRRPGEPLYFLNSKRHELHWSFVEQFLLGPQYYPTSMALSDFNDNTYYSPDRYFVVGTITWYQEPDVWALEFAPYDTASPEMMELAYEKIRENSFLDDRIQLHMTSEAQEALIPDLQESTCVVSTERLFEGITYDPKNLGHSTGLLTFHTAEEVDGVPINFREIVVLDAVPNDIGITAGIITDAYQTPLAHINVLAHNRGTPNMVLIGAYDDPELRALEGKWVDLTVATDGYTIFEITAEEAEAWWDDNRPDPLGGNPPDLSWTEITWAEDLLDFDPQDIPNTLGPALQEAIPRFGGKASHFGGLVHIGPEVRVPQGFAVPIYWYWRFMEENSWQPNPGGPEMTFRETILSWEDPTHPNYDAKFSADPQYRQDQLHALQIAMVDGDLPAGFDAQLQAKLAEYPDRDINGDGVPEKVRMRYRSSTNAEDLGNFTGAGLYSSHAGIYGDENEPHDLALKSTWASVWNPRAYDERDYYGITQTNVGMALLCHRSFPNEEVNGVAITRNVLGDQFIEPAFFINAQTDGWSVVLPDFGVRSDALTYHFTKQNQPVVYHDHSNIIPAGYTVMDTTQLFELGTALTAIHLFFEPVYGNGDLNYAMDTEFKFDDDETTDGTRLLYMKQARPYAGLSAEDEGTN